MNMRKLLLGLLPIACTISSADTQPQQRIAAPNNQPIIEKGSGCRVDDAEIASDGTAVRGRPSKPAPRSVKGRDSEESPSAKKDAIDTEDDAGYDRKPARRSPSPDAAPRPMPRPTVTTGAGGRPGVAPPPSPTAAKIATARPPMEQPSGVRAGEWDDNANYRDYVKWLAGSSTKGRIDVTGRQFLVVTDSAGKPMPNVPVTITGNQTSTKLITMASGRAILFPTAFGLRGDLTATATWNGSTVSAKVATATVDGVVKLQLPTQRPTIAKRQIDLAFVLDTTGSMSEEIEAVKQTIKAVSDQLSNAQTDVRIGLVEYKDRSDCLLTRTFPFSNDLRAFSTSVANISASGGGDMPEDMH